MKNKLFLLLLIQFVISPHFHFIRANEPDSAYIFAYSTIKNNGKNGLHFAWSIDEKYWNVIGSEYSYLKSDYGHWGDEKRMLDPVLFQSPDGLWHCIWDLNRKGAMAYVTSKDLVYWGRQSYYGTEAEFKTFDQNKLKSERSKRQDIIISGTTETGTINKVSWSVVDGLIKTYQLAMYDQQLWDQKTKNDPERFASLKPVDIKIAPQISESKKISDVLVGIFFEDLNYAADGGLYAELIQNRDFEYSLNDRLGQDKDWNSKKAWQTVGNGITFMIDSISPIHPNNKHYAVLQFNEPGGKFINEGFAGISMKAGEKYNFSIFARTLSSNGGKMLVRLTDKTGKIYGETSVKVSSSQWKKLNTVLIAKETASNLQLEVIPEIKGSIALDMISLFPQNTFKGRKNGLRADLAQVIADIHPRFVRFPGGCLAHGDGLDNMYRWKNTIGPLEARVPQRNIWNYHQTAGLGYLEYFLFCEDIGAEPLPVVPAGVPCQNSHDHGHSLGGQQGGIPMSEMDDYIQEVLDLIEWANGDVKTKWGKIRAESGHPKPFNLKYLGVGNEDLISDIFEERFTMIFNAVKEKYPEVTVIGTAGPFFQGTDYVEGWKIVTKLGVPMVDEHYYQTPGWFIHNQDFYDKYDRNKSKVYLGEYAAHLPGRPSNLEVALAEGLYMTSLERNGDVVSMASYAPLLAKEGFTQWKPDLIYFTNTEVKPTVSYYVQKLFGQNSGDVYIPQTISYSNNWNEVKNRVGVSVVKDTKSNELILKIVNLLPVDINSSFDLTPFQISENKVTKTVLQGSPEDSNVKPAETILSLEEVRKMNLAPYSLTLLRIKL